MLFENTNVLRAKQNSAGLLINLLSADTLFFLGQPDKLKYIKTQDVSDET